MKPPNGKTSEGEKAPRTKPPRLAEIRKILEGYANDLREILKKLRKQLN
jgi:hypothetical protein